MKWSGTEQGDGSSHPAGRGHGLRVSQLGARRGVPGPRPPSGVGLSLPWGLEAVAPYGFPKTPRRR